MGVPEKIKKIEDELRKTQINKSTEHHVGLLKAKLAKLKNQQDEVRKIRLLDPKYIDDFVDEYKQLMKESII